MKQKPTINDVKRIWDIKWGNYIYDKNERDRKWKAVKKQAKKDWASVEEWYEFMCNATGLV